MARPRKVPLETVPRGTMDILDVVENSAILSRLRIIQQYVQYVALIDVADIVPFSLYGRVETIFPKLGLVVKRKFGFLGYNWGYGVIREVRHGETSAVLTAPVSLHIYFQKPIDEDFLIDNASKFGDIVIYLRREMEIYRGVVTEEF